MSIIALILLRKDWKAIGHQLKQVDKKLTRKLSRGLKS